MNTLRSFPRLFTFLHEHSRSIHHSRLLLVITVVLSSVSGIASIALLALVNSALSGGETDSILAPFVGLCVLLPTTRFASSYALAKLTQQVVYSLYDRLSRKILRSPLHHLERVGASRIVAVLTEDVHAISHSVSLLPSLGMHASTVVGVLVYLTWLSPVVSGVVIGICFVGVVTYYVPLVRALKHFRIARKARDGMHDHFEAMTGGTKELKIHGPRRRSFFSKRLLPTAETLREAVERGQVIYAAASSWGQVLFFVVIGLLLFLVPEFQTLPSGVLSGYVLGLLYLMGPLEVLLNTLPELSRAAISVQKLESLGIALAEKTESSISLEKIPDSSVAWDGEPTRLAGWTSLQLDDVEYAYHAEQGAREFTLGPINLKLTPGEIVFLTGGNGSGKTTLVKLLMGLYEPVDGNIWVDGEVIGNGSREAYRSLFSAVFYDFYLFDDLIGIDDEQVETDAQGYLRDLDLEDKVDVKGGGLTTTNLSQGQRKRLALLTAYLEDRSIYVFDEWAADQDPTFRRTFYHSILPSLRSKGKTVVAITHDDRFYHLADRIVHLKYGTIERIQHQNK